MKSLANYSDRKCGNLVHNTSVDIEIFDYKFISKLQEHFQFAIALDDNMVDNSESSLMTITNNGDISKCSHN